MRMDCAALELRKEAVINLWCFFAWFPSPGRARWLADVSPHLIFGHVALRISMYVQWNNLTMGVQLINQRQHVLCGVEIMEYSLSKDIQNSPCVFAFNKAISRLYEFYRKSY